ncbi:MAG TPA: glycoside hydrolase family 3 N-terminal domain-containing protein [Ktedonobacterales bacterium]
MRTIGHLIATVLVALAKGLWWLARQLGRGLLAGLRVLGRVARRGALGITRGPHRRAWVASALAIALALIVIVTLTTSSLFRNAASIGFFASHRVTPTASATATPTPRPSPHPGEAAPSGRAQAEAAYIRGLVSKMSTNEKIGQMIMFEFTGAEMSPAIEQEIKEFHPAGVIIYKWNITDANSIRTLDQQMQDMSAIPLLIATDQEGGVVNRLAFEPGYRPSAEEMGQRNDPNFVYQRGHEDAQQMYDLGMNFNLAPVVDVQNIPDGQSVMSSRMFGTTPDKVASLAGAYLNGLQADGHVVGTLKHFPGLGDVPGDPHEDHEIYLNRSVDQLEAIDWVPYRTLLATGQVQAIMTTHLIMPSIDTVPTTISYKITTGLLRQKLGFDGVIITDGIYMQSIGYDYSFRQTILGAVQAGNDLIASTYSYSSTADAVHILQGAVADGTITQDRLNQSVQRVLLMKLHMGLIHMPS